MKRILLILSTLCSLAIGLAQEVNIHNPISPITNTSLNFIKISTSYEQQTVLYKTYLHHTTRPLPMIERLQADAVVNKLGNVTDDKDFRNAFPTISVSPAIESYTGYH